MCLGIPARVLQVDESALPSRPAVVIRQDGVEFIADLAMTPEALPGDYVVTHSGYSVGVLSETAAHAAIELLESVRGAVM